MSIAQLGQTRLGPIWLPTPGPALSSPPSTAPALPQTPYGSGQPSPKPVTQPQVKYVSYTQAVTAALLTSLIIAVITAFAMYGIMRHRKPVKATDPQPEPIRQMDQAGQAGAKQLKEQVTALNWVGGIMATNTVPIWPTAMDGKKYFPNPLDMDELRFHPRQINSDCALHALQMLLGGNPALLPSVLDLHMARNALRLTRRTKFDGSTIIQPDEFAEIYKKILENKVNDTDEARIRLEELEKSKTVSQLTPRDQTDYDQLQQIASKLPDRLTLAKDVKERAENLDVQEFSPNQNDGSTKNAALRAALKKLEGPRIILAKPLIDGSLGPVQGVLEFKHHYVALEQGLDGYWFKRDPMHANVKHLKTSDGKHITDAYEAVKAELTWEQTRPAGTSNIHLKKPTYVFIPLAK
jgi:hypothetical protein